MTFKMKAVSTFLVGVALAGASLAGCARSGGSTNSYSAELDRLEADCKAREGILTPTGSQSGHPQRDYACRISGASRLH